MAARRRYSAIRGARPLASLQRKPWKKLRERRGTRTTPPRPPKLAASLASRQQAQHPRCAIAGPSRLGLPGQRCRRCSPSPRRAATAAGGTLNSPSRRASNPPARRSHPSPRPPARRPAATAMRRQLRGPRPPTALKKAAPPCPSLLPRRLHPPPRHGPGRPSRPQARRSAGLSCGRDAPRSSAEPMPPQRPTPRPSAIRGPAPWAVPPRRTKRVQAAASHRKAISSATRHPAAGGCRPCIRSWPSNTPAAPPDDVRWGSQRGAGAMLPPTRQAHGRPRCRAAAAVATSPPTKPKIAASLPKPGLPHCQRGQWSWQHRQHPLEARAAHQRLQKMPPLTAPPRQRRRPVQELPSPPRRRRQHPERRPPRRVPAAKSALPEWKRRQGPPRASTKPPARHPRRSCRRRRPPATSSPQTRQRRCRLQRHRQGHHLLCRQQPRSARLHQPECCRQHCEQEQRWCRADHLSAKHSPSRRAVRQHQLQKQMHAMQVGPWKSPAPSPAPQRNDRRCNPVKGCGWRQHPEPHSRNRKPHSVLRAMFPRRRRTTMVLQRYPAPAVG